MWRWSGQGATFLTQDQLAGLDEQFLLEEIQAAIKGLNGKGALGLDDISVFFN